MMFAASISRGSDIVMTCPLGYTFADVNARVSQETCAIAYRVMPFDSLAGVCMTIDWSNTHSDEPVIIIYTGDYETPVTVH